MCEIEELRSSIPKEVENEYRYKTTKRDILRIQEEFRNKRREYERQNEVYIANERKKALQR